MQSRAFLQYPGRALRDFMRGEGAEPVGSSPQEFAAYLRAEIERYAKVVKAGNLKID